MPASFEQIASITLGSANNNINFTSIPQTYTDLKFIGYVSQDSSNYNLTISSINGDTSSNYSWRILTVNNSYNPIGANAINSNNVNLTETVPGTYETGIFGTFELDIFNYRNTNVYRHFIGKTGVTNGNGGKYGSLTGGVWRGGSAITEINFRIMLNGFTAGSRISLYGIKKA